MFRTATALALAATLALPTLAGAEETSDPNIIARQAQMNLMAYNLGVLGGMAQGRIPYDAAMASAAATSLHQIATIDHGRMWPEGSDNMSADDTRALPAIWDDMAGFETRYATLATASEAMVGAAGTDLATLQGAVRGLGGACGGCHQTYRQPE